MNAPNENWISSFRVSKGYNLIISLDGRINLSGIENWNMCLKLYSLKSIRMLPNFQTNSQISQTYKQKSSRCVPVFLWFLFPIGTNRKSPRDKYKVNLPKFILYKALTGALPFLLWNFDYISYKKWGYLITKLYFPAAPYLYISAYVSSNVQVLENRALFLN